MRQEQALADLAIGQTLRGEPRDVKLLGGQLIAGIRAAGAECLACGAQLLARPITPADRAQEIEQLDRFAQRIPRLDAAPLPAQPTAERKQRSRARV